MLKSFENRDGWIWMNGKIIPWQDANSHIISQGLHYASAVFEGERAYNGKIFKSEEHTKRFFKSAEIIGMEIPFTYDQINKAKYELINKMNYKNCYVRPLAWRGGDQMGLSTGKSNINVAIAVWDDWATYFKTLIGRHFNNCLTCNPIEKTIWNRSMDIVIFNKKNVCSCSFSNITSVI